MQSIESVNGLPFVVTRWVTAFGDLVVRRSWLVLLFGTKRVCFGNGCVGGIRSRTSFGMLKVSMLGIADPVRGGVSELVSVACLQEAQDAVRVDARTSRLLRFRLLGLRSNFPVRLFGALVRLENDEQNRKLDGTIRGVIPAKEVVPF